MQGMNFNYDSTYIQNTIQENPKTEAFDLSDKADSTVNFMQMIHSAKTEMSEPVKDFNSESVKGTDREVTKSSYETAESKAIEKDMNDVSDKKNEVAVNDKDVQKADDISEKNEKKVSDAEAFLARLLNASENKTEVKESAPKVLAAKKALNTFKDVNSNPSDAQKISVLKERVDDQKLMAMIENIKDLKISDKKEFDDADLLASQLQFAQDIKVMPEVSDVKMEKEENSNLISKDSKIKKTEKKLADVISVTDLRTEAAGEKKSQLTTAIKQTSNDSVSMTMDLNNQAQKNILSLDSQTAGAQGSNFQAMLENQIFENSADFVKAGKIVLKDNDVGNIDLILHPASLGNVKISLELSDKVITGKILVSSQEALDAFNATQESLKTAFIESGFDGASFDVAFANQNTDFSNAGQNQNDNSREAKQSYGNYVVENTLVDESNSDIYNDDRDYSLNIVA